MKPQIKPIIISVLGTLLFFTVLSVNAQGLSIIDPWVRAAPPNAPALAAFMKIENHSATDVSITEVRTTLPLDHVELHRTLKADGMMKMIPQKTIPIAANSSTTLKPGSWHIMLIKPKKVPDIGSRVQLTLVLDDGSEQTVMATVRKGKMMKHMMMKHN